ncbi:LacI family DNA-binding transcriptional regulator [Listeria booriae]|uniref:LacI family transcriptional regulator n=1 Tax=Listeria booriae TaxID=1552123 RepID=A0A7X1DIU6_9LIST|nr:LacI family DNA-binding transcriptional regulator [Listeria booriae]MBC2283623.1 LacI family transcriptional regulator [Listeria booriae]MBC2293132.1 LacI family transcriptional regulator [Listeria booriae]MBC2306367.1 LacI family transcriptional regulator [Listeria booriae]MBC2309281.1 LacI family transcriptional regulator [Listeria booriae]
MATLADVAKKANVSKMTVSRVINHPDQVSDELKQLVYHAMEELEYVPNYAARALVQNRTQVVKFLILEEIDTVEPYYMNLLTGISRELDKHSYSLQLVTQKSKNIGPYDGLIVTGMRDQEIDKVLAGLEKPVIAYGENRRNIDAIDVDNRLGAELATKHLYDIGFRQIIFFGINLLEEEFMRSRLTGYSSVMKVHDLIEESYFMKNSSRIAEKKALEILQNAKKPTAIVCASDRMAIGVVRAATALHMNFGENIAVTGFDGVFLDRISSPKITTVRSPVIEMGETCAQLLLKKINEGGAQQGSILFPPELIIRGSTVVGRE